MIMRMPIMSMNAVTIRTASFPTDDLSRGTAGPLIPCTLESNQTSPDPRETAAIPGSGCDSGRLVLFSGARGSSFESRRANYLWGGDLAECRGGCWGGRVTRQRGSPWENGHPDVTKT